ncbi:MAG: GNAT family N-acetyltransferase [Verrucomicrobiae bacterium]|nr:GNAT family N-acetyltransferase [Verrucomicrobiae bacterium]
MQANLPAHSPSLCSPTQSAAASFRRAVPDDFNALRLLESDSFETARRDSGEVIRQSLRNPLHEVWVSEESPGEIDAALFLRRSGRTLRIHSLAVHPSHQGRGLGNRLIEWALLRATALGCNRATLEADLTQPALVDWYERRGFRQVKLLPGYYGPDHDACRMVLSVGDSISR